MFLQLMARVIQQVYYTSYLFFSFSFFFNVIQNEIEVNYVSFLNLVAMTIILIHYNPIKRVPSQKNIYQT